MVNISCVGTNIDFLCFWCYYVLVSEPCSNFLQVLMMIVYLRMSNCSDTRSPLRLLFTEQVFVNVVFDCLNNSLDSITNAIWRESCVVMLLPRVVKLTVSNWTKSECFPLEISRLELADLASIRRCRFRCFRIKVQVLLFSLHITWYPKECLLARTVVCFKGRFEGTFIKLQN